MTLQFVKTMNVLEKLGWYKQEHTILGKVQVRWHKNGFEVPDSLMQEILNNKKECHHCVGREEDDDESGRAIEQASQTSRSDSGHHHANIGSHL